MSARGGCAAVAFAAAIAAAMGCRAEAEPRSQALVYVDTDLPVPAFADTLRIDVLDAANNVVTTRDVAAPDRRDWPISFGISARTRLRLRLFPAWRASGPSGTVGVPRAEFSIDRVVSIDVPAAGIAHVGVLLEGDCLGVPADVAAGKSCARVNGKIASDAPPDAALARFEAPPVDTLAGTWSAALPKPCAREAARANDEEEVCIPGGVFFLGDERLEEPGCWCRPLPERLVSMSPFFMDRYEVTVARFRAALERGFVPPKDSYVDYDESSVCTFTREAGKNEKLPITCVSFELAEAFCRFDGGALPTEAQWEYAASGRGEERLYSWGNETPTCDKAAYARTWSGPDTVPGEAECAARGRGTAPVGSYPIDRSRDGVNDLSGNAHEWTSDAVARYGEACWGGAATPLDPSCPASGSAPRVLRGGSFRDTAVALAVSRRFSPPLGTNPRFASWLGFRCVRKGTP